jgi:class 3 adenylate cyclase
MIERSPEIISVVRRWNEAMRRKDKGTLTNMLSTSEHLCYQGSAEGETWSGTALRDGFAAHASEIPEFDWEETSLNAFESGQVGWAHCLASLRFHSNGSLVLCRFTFVLVLEDGMWRIIQMHSSNGFPNMDKMGVEQTALDALIQAAREDFTLDQREGMATVMFSDVVNSTALANALGDTVWVATVRHHIALIEKLVTAAGGRLIKSLGDGTMSTFSSARVALRVAREIQRENAKSDREPPLQLRIGLHSGSLIQTGDDFFGSVVNKAARVASAATPGEIRVSEATSLMAGSGPDLSYVDPVDTELRGFGGTHLLFRLNW